MVVVSRIGEEKGKAEVDRCGFLPSRRRTSIFDSLAPSPFISQTPVRACAFLENKRSQCRGWFYSVWTD